MNGANALKIIEDGKNGLRVNSFLTVSNNDLMIREDISDSCMWYVNRAGIFMCYSVIFLDPMVNFTFSLTGWPSETARYYNLDFRYSEIGFFKENHLTKLIDDNFILEEGRIGAAYEQVAGLIEVTLWREYEYELSYDPDKGSFVKMNLPTFPTNWDGLDNKLSDTIFYPEMNSCPQQT